MTELMVNQARCAVDIDLFFTIASHHRESVKGPKVRRDTCPGRGQQLRNPKYCSRIQAVIAHRSLFEGPQACSLALQPAAGELCVRGVVV